MSITKTPKEIRLVRSLMTLRNISAPMLAEHTGIQLENLNAWLSGTSSALHNRSYVAMLTYLGLTKHGLSGSYVQVWNLDASRSFNDEQVQAFNEISTWLSGGQITEITGDYQKWSKKVRVFAIRGKHFKILVKLQGGIRKPLTLKPEHFNNTISERMKDGAASSESHVDSLYWHAARTGQLTPSEFDDIFLETFDKWSWNDVRLIARERGITPTDLAESILAKDGKNNNIPEMLQEEKVAPEKSVKQEVPIERNQHVMFTR